MADPTYQDVMTALRAADAAGNAEDAAQLAQIADRIQNTTAKPLTLKERFYGGALKGGLTAGIPGAVLGGMNEISKAGTEAYEKFAYDAGGNVTDIATKAGASPETAALAGYGTNVGIQALPMAAGAIAGRAAPLLEKAGKGVMQSAVKPNLEARKSGEADRALDSMLKKGINPTDAAMDATRLKVDKLEGSLDTILGSSSQTGSKPEIAKAIKTALDDVRLSPNVIENLKDINDALAKFMNHPALKAYGDEIPVAVVNQMKQAFYKDLSGKVYLPGQSITAEDKANKALAAGMRAEVGKKVPETIPTLAEQSELLNVLKVAGASASGAGNKNLVGLGWLSTSMQRTLLWMIDRYPWMKGLLARTLYTGAEPIAYGTGGALGAVGGQIAAKKIEQANQ